MAMINVCGLWTKESKSGKKYLSGLDIKAIQQLDPDKYRLMIFKNDKKDKQGNFNEKAPDYSVMAAENDPKFQKKAAPQPLARPEPAKPKNYAPPQSAWDEDDIGF